MAALKGYQPTSARFASPKGTFYRLSVQGFNSFGEANSLCSSLRQTGWQLLRPQGRGRFAGPVRVALSGADQHFQARHSNGDAHFDLERDQGSLRVVGDSVLDFDPAVHGAGMHDHGLR